jgi:nucleotide-binding universal stress UspA family protein
LIEGEPSQAIPAFCKEQEADLLICGTVARHGIRGLLLGNTAERIVNRIDCSILALTPQA